MFTADDADSALAAVATYLNCDISMLRILRGDPATGLIAITDNRAGIGNVGGTYVYDTFTHQVGTINAVEDPETTLGIVAER